MLDFHADKFTNASETNAPVVVNSCLGASIAFVEAMDNLIDGLKEIEAEFLAKAAERSEKLKANRAISTSI
jgi:hypothetical protein